MFAFTIGYSIQQITAVSGLVTYNRNFQKSCFDITPTVCYKYENCYSINSTFFLCKRIPPYRFLFFYHGNLDSI